MSFKISSSNNPKSTYSTIDEFITVEPNQLLDVTVASNWQIEPCFMPRKYETIADKILNFNVRPDDVWIIAYPKCGTTWTQEMTWLLLNDLDYATANTVLLIKRQHFIEIETIHPDDFPIPFQSLDVADNLESPRFIKSHLPVGLLPKQLWTIRPKIIYVARNPKDTAISFYHHYRHLHGYCGTFDDFMDAFLDDKIVYSPFHSHIISFWNMRNESNIFFLTYESMKKDHIAVLKLLAKFLGKSYSVEKLEILGEHLTFAKMRENESVNFAGLVKIIKSSKFHENSASEPYEFVRKGEAGGFKNEMSTDMIAKFDQWTRNKLKKSDFQFDL